MKFYCIAHPLTISEENLKELITFHKKIGDPLSKKQFNLFSDTIDLNIKKNS